MPPLQPQVVHVLVLEPVSMLPLVAKGTSRMWFNKGF